MRENRYLRDKMIGRYSDREYDGRNRYGSSEGYISSSRRDRNDYEGSDYRDRRDYEDYERRDRYSNYDFESDYRGRDRKSDDAYRKYEVDLEKWTEKLKKHDKFRLSKEDIMNRARSMGVRFDDYSLEEFLVVYYMLMSDFPNVANDSSTYLNMAKKWLEDDDIEVSPSEKLCIYYYDIVKGKCF